MSRLLAARWKARTDLLWLCNNILGYRDINREYHYPILNILPQFPLPPMEERQKYDNYTQNGGFLYRPYKPLRELPGVRRRLILDPRSTMKTTVNVISHTIQLILNYPDIALLIVHAKQEIAEEILGEIKGQFQANRVMRELFPEYCPPENKRDFGTRQKFTVPCRSSDGRRRKEPTVGISSIDTAVAGLHYDYIKFTDIITDINTGTKEQMNKVAYTFGMYRNVLVVPNDFIDVEGTRYHYNDLYGRIIDTEAKKPKEERRWLIHVRGIYKKDTKGKPYTFTPEEMDDTDYMRDEKGQYVSWWESRFPVKDLEDERNDASVGSWLFSTQKLNNPVDTSDEKPFPIKLIKYKSREDMSRVPIAYYTTTVDTAETQGASADNTAIVTCGWDQYGRCYVVDVKHGKMLPSEIVTMLFVVYAKWKPVNIKIEETGFVRGLKSSIRRYEDIQGVYLPLDFTPRDNQVAKIQRILNTLQPWYKRGEVIFVDDLPCREAIEQELTRFPAGKDDILDALADQFQNREWFGRNAVRKPIGDTIRDEQQARIYGPTYGLDIMETNGDTYYDRTGGL